MIAYRLTLSLALIASLAACGPSSESRDGEGATAAAAGGGMTAAVGGGSVECKDLPPHVVLPPDAKVTLCTRGQTRPGHVSGSINFTTAMAPDAVIAFARDKAHAAGLKDGVSAPSAYSAIDGKHSIMVIPEVASGGAKVMLNWGMDQ